MNRNHHRIVFNAKRGQLMAVSETAQSCARSSASGEGPASATRPKRRGRLPLALLLAFATLALPAQSQIVADPNAAGSLRPTVLSASNGVPLVNIATPSAAGVSRNVYRQFDVSTQGAILNNSRTDVQTQLGGWVQGNPWLATGLARVILNEVHSSQPSQLNGFVEVGGQRAEVVIANPAGINVNGGGFINASRTTLTTGVPVMNAGALEGFRVLGGQIKVEGLGLDATQTDHAAILARAVKVNAGIWAQALTVVTGANEVSADSARITPLNPGSATGAAPAFALDVAALGGMYAGKIHLVGTEAGLGVNQAGLIDARGALTLDVDGWLSQSAGARTYGDAVSIAAQGLRNEDGAVIAARERLQVAVQNIINREGALLLSAGDMVLSASERLENRSAGIEALGSLSISTPVLVNANDHISHTVVSDATTNHTVYFTPGGAVDAADVAWSVVKPLGEGPQTEYDAYRREWLLPKSSAWADPAFKAYYLGALPYVPAHVIWWDFGDSGYSEAVGDTFTYGRHSPVWAHFGMSAPTWDAPGQRPGGTVDSEGTPLSPPDPQAVAAWEAQAAPWVELTTRVASFKTAVEAQFLRFDAHSSYAQTTQRAVMTGSEPARLSSGGSMNLNASQSLLNQDSEIVAGGALSITGVQVTNQATEVSAPTSRSGTFSSWGVTGRDCGPFGCDPEYGWIQTPYVETVANAVPLPALRYESYSATLPTAAPSAALSALFALNPDPASGPVFETDPRFADHRQWLSSDHLLSALAVDPATTHKRLGDGFIEQHLIREQVGQLTGRRFLGDFTTDEAQYLALMDAGTTFAQAHQLRPGITLSVEQVAALTSDIVWLETRTITLPDGTNIQALVPRVYLLPRAGDLSASGALIAGRDVQMNLSGDVLNTGHIAGRNLVQISAQNLVNTGLINAGSTAVSAREDVSNVGGTISATDALVLQAGRDLNVQTTTAQGTGSTGMGRYRSEQVNRVAGLYVSNDAGVLLASAGRDVNLTAAVLQAGSVDVQAGRDLNLTSVNTSSSLDATRDARNFARVQQSAEVGTRMQGASVALQAGQDLTARAASVQAQGALVVNAGRDIALNAGEASYQIDHGVYARSSGLLGSSSVETRTHNSRTDAMGSSLGGAQVVIHSRQDISLTGSSAVADDQTDITAGRDVNITAAQTRWGQDNFREEKASGVFSSGGGITLGSQQHSTDQQTRGTEAAASTVGAIGGNVKIAAGGAYAQTGSDVLAPGGDIAIQARSIAITEARTIERSISEEKFKQGGISIGLGGALVEAAQGVMQMAESVGKTQDSRMQALGAATAALQGYNALQGLSAPAAGSSAQGVGMSVSISIGASQSESRTESQRNNAQGSTIVAGGDISLRAAGAGEHSDILIQGSRIKAGQVATLNAEDDVDLLAATNTTQESSRSKNSSASIGVSLGTQTGITVAASAGKGHGSGEETVHSNTRIEAGEQVRIDSGANTTLRGAVVAAPKVQARIGGDLLIESLQDTSAFHELSKQTGGSVTFGAAPGASVSTSKTKIDSEIASVSEQSAIRAGDGGFDVRVKGATNLKGGAVTSSQAAVHQDLNTFESVGGLATGDIHNTASFKASSSGVTVGVGSQLGASGAGIGSDKGSASSTTHAAISGIAGYKAARTGDAETGIAPIFDEGRVRDEVEAQAAITKAFGQQAVPVAASYADDQAVDLRRKGKEEEARKWDEGGEYRVALHASLGLLTGGSAGALGAATGAAMIPVIGEAAAGLNLPEPVRQAATVVTGALLGAATGDTAGAATSFNQTAHNYVSHSPFASVRRTVSQENARLMNACAASCTAEDFRRIDLQMVALEQAGNLSEIAQRSALTPEQARQLAQVVLELAPLYGNGEALAQLLTGKSSLTGEDASKLWAAVGLMPVVGGVFRKMVEPSAEMLSAVLRNNMYRDGGDPGILKQMFEAAARNSTVNPNGTEVVLGRFIAGDPDSYEQVARRLGATFFEMLDWKTVEGQIGTDKIWSINKAFLDQQIAAEKSFLFTSNPVKLDPRSFTAKEFRHLLDNGYQLIEQPGGFYRAVKK